MLSHPDTALAETRPAGATTDTRPAGAMAGVRCLVLGGTALEVVRKSGRAADVPVSVLDTALIRRATGWRPGVDWMDGLAETASWMRRAYGF